MSDPIPRLRQYSPVTWAVERLFYLLKQPSAWILRDRLDLQTAAESEVVKRARCVEFYVLVWVVIELVAAITAALSSAWVVIWLVRVVVTIRIIDILQAAVNISVFDQVRAPGKHKVASVVRVLVLSSVNFLELIMSFGVIYLSALHTLRNASVWYDAFYFSAITQFTIGYGDIRPTGLARVLAVVQGLAGILFIVLVLARIVSILPEYQEVMKEPADSENSQVDPRYGEG